MDFVQISRTFPLKMSTSWWRFHAIRKKTDEHSFILIGWIWSSSSSQYCIDDHSCKFHFTTERSWSKCATHADIHRLKKAKNVLRKKKNTFVRNKCAVAGKKHLLATKLKKSLKKTTKKWLSRLNKLSTKIQSQIEQVKSGSKTSYAWCKHKYRSSNAEASTIFQILFILCSYTKFVYKMIGMRSI